MPRQLGWSVVLLLTFVVIAATSGLMHDIPLRVILFGAGSYVFPVIGLVIGYQSSKSESQRLASVYCLVNALLVGSAFLEVAGIKSAALGGIMMEWHRFRGDHSIPLPCGIYRSPDILGLHAAHVFSFALLFSILTVYSRRRIVWLLVTAWGAILLVVSARRKMQGLALVFFFVVAGVLVANIFRASRFGNRSAILGKSPITVILIAISLFAIGAVALCEFAAPQCMYAFSVIEEGPERLASTLIHRPLVTVRQSGFWGRGLGSATQGSQVVGAGFESGWQEDGVSRLFIEGGVLGAAVAILAALTVTLQTICFVFWRSRSVQESDGIGAWDVGLLGLFFGNFACFVVSHQHLSGDPMQGALAGYWLGCLWHFDIPQESNNR